MASESSAAFADAVEQLTAAVQHLRTATPDRLPRLQEPEPFSGDRTKYRTWKAYLQLWLAGFPNATSPQRARLVAGFLKGEAQDVLFNLLERGGDLTFELLMQTLDSMFTNHNEAHAAREQWDSLSQGDMSVVEFASLVRRIAATPGLEDIRQSEASLIHRFRYRLRPDRHLGTRRPGSQPPPGRRQQGTASSTSRRLAVAGRNGSFDPDKRCSQCGLFGHWYADCPVRVGVAAVQGLVSSGDQQENGPAQ